MSQSIAILGRQPALGLAELESLFGSDAVLPAGPIAALLEVDAASIDFNRLGGSIKLARVLTKLESNQWPAVEKYLRQTAPKLAKAQPDGKLKLGLSVHGFDITISKLNATGLTLKKAIKNTGRSVRVVPNKELELNSAQVLHNSLTSPAGLELLVVRDGSATWIAQTAAVQDIDAYAARDQGRPKRDARVGMLPPKLAQTIVNLATGPTPPSRETTILDPFCGTGVILQEALLMGYSAVGSDIEQRMIDYTSTNLDWLRKIYPEVWDVNSGFQLGDATSHQWQNSKFILQGEEAIDAELVPMKIDVVACEGYLGQPFTVFPPGEKLAEIRNTCNTILRKTLQNLSDQLVSGSRLCLAVPAWQQSTGQFVHLPTLDHLEELGYNRVSFKHVDEKDLVYARADQIVARELLVLTKN